MEVCLIFGLTFLYKNLVTPSSALNLWLPLIDQLSRTYIMLKHLSPGGTPFALSFIVILYPSISFTFILIVYSEKGKEIYVNLSS